MGETNVTVTCPFHHKTLVSGLWNLFVADQNVDFFLQWGDQAVRAHRLVLDAFLSPDTIGAGSPSPFGSGQHDDLDAVFQFIYKGRVTLSQPQLESCLGLAKQLDFKMLVDAIDACKPGPDAASVTISSPLHHQTLIDKLWNSFTDKRGINFFLRWRNFPIAAHQVVVDVFLDVDNIIAAPSGVSIGKSKKAVKCSLDHLVEFMYRGRVVVRRDELRWLLILARELDFGMLVEAVEGARKDLGMPEIKLSDKTAVDTDVDTDADKSRDDPTSCSEDELMDEIKAAKAAKKSGPAGSKIKKKKYISIKKKPKNKSTPHPPGECIIEQLMTEPFAKRDLEDKKAIAKAGRPTPSLPKLTTEIANTGHMRHFQDSNYTKLNWLTGCPRLNRVFCWPCVLFSGSYYTWDRQGFADLNNFHSSSVRHEASMAHAASVRLLDDLCGNPKPSSSDGAAKKSGDLSAADSARAAKAKIVMCGNPSGCIIEQLLEKPFNKRDSHDQEKIVLDGRLTPSLPDLKAMRSGFCRRFQDNWYEKTDWLTGCQKVNRVYCWPCLLLSKEVSSWTRHGHHDLCNMYSAIHRHELSQKHVTFVKALAKRIRKISSPSPVDSPAAPQPAECPSPPQPTEDLLLEAVSGDTDQETHSPAAQQPAESPLPPQPTEDLILEAVSGDTDQET